MSSMLLQEINLMQLTVIYLNNTKVFCVHVGFPEIFNLAVNFIVIYGQRLCIENAMFI